jgi:cysteine synthase A
VRDEEAFAFCHALYESTGIKVGGSSGAVLAACARYLAEHPDVNETVCICPDTGDNYTSSIYNDEWLARHNLLLAGGLGRVERIVSCSRENV